MIQNRLEPVKAFPFLPGSAFCAEPDAGPQALPLLGAYSYGTLAAYVANNLPGRYNMSGSFGGGGLARLAGD